MLRSMGQLCIASRCRASTLQSPNLVRDFVDRLLAYCEERSPYRTHKPAAWRTVMKSILIGILMLLFLTNLASGQQPTATNSNNDQSAAHKYFIDTILINQNGEKMRFYTDLLQGKTVIIDTFFSTCKTACLPMTQNLKRIQEALGERLGKDIYILSVTVDSEMDTPAQLKAFADKFHARPGWYFLTGTKENVDFVLRKLGQYVDNKQ